MNERINELAKQAGFYADKYGQCESQFGNVLVDGGDFIDLEKFAELIVQECLVKIKVWEQDSRNHISYLLKQHFGIEQ